MSDAEYAHRPVLLTEVLEGLAIQQNGIYIDATFGRGGHSAAVLKALAKDGRLLAIDKDPHAIAIGLELCRQDPRLTVEQGSFATLRDIAERHGVLGKVNGILLDLGVSSPQLDDPERGFSFLREGPLDMRMDPTQGISAAKWLNTAKEADIAHVLKTYGEERYARRIARAIVEQRPITTTMELSAIVSAANPAWERSKHPATRSFQAIRIFINRELEELDICLNACLEVLASGGRLVVISFHSLEDRMVKHFMKRHARGGDIPAYLPIPQAKLKQELRIVGRAIKPSAIEVAENPRARSAILRIMEKSS